MGFRQAAALSSVCFLLGVLFISFNADYRVLYQPLTEPAIEDAMHYYKTFYNAPKAVQNLLHGVAAVGILSLIAKLHQWDESAMFFDGTSLGVFVFGVMLYTTVVIPGIRTVADPIAEETRQDQVEALRVLAAGNTLIVICLGLVLAFQAGQEWARRTEAKALAAAISTEKKDNQISSRRPTATATAFPLVDYSDDESDDDGYDEGYDEAMYPKEGSETRRGYASEIDAPIPGIAVMARNRIESGSTVVQIPPYAILSYPNVFGSPIPPTRVGPIRPENARISKSASAHGRWHCIANDGPTTEGAGGTSSQQQLLQHQLSQKREPRSASTASDTVNERSGYGATLRGVDDEESFLIANTARSSNIGDEAPAAAGVAATIGVASASVYSADVIESLLLSLALLNELVKGETSRWWGYLQSLPDEEPAIALFWDDVDFDFDFKGVDQQEHARLEACRRARRRITGTQLDRYLRSTAIQRQKMEIRTFFTRIVSPFLQRHGYQDTPSQWIAFRRAYTLVSTRAFLVDAYHGLALVPIADAFNHSEEHDVHLETDWEVCRDCGALEACGHDDEEDLSDLVNEDGSNVKAEPIVHSFDMVSDRPVNQDKEVFNTYNVERGVGAGAAGGDAGGIGNVELLCRYGFVVEGNGADLIVFDEEELGVVEAGHKDYNYNDDSPASSQLLIDAGLVKEDSHTPSYEMDAEGRITLALWTRLGSPANRRAATAVVGLCEGRLREIYGDDDECSGPVVLTVVGHYVRGERALLEAAVQLWKEMQ